MGETKTKLGVHPANSNVLHQGDKVSAVILSIVCKCLRSFTIKIKKYLKQEVKLKYELN